MGGWCIMWGRRVKNLWAFLSKNNNENKYLSLMWSCTFMNASCIYTTLKVLKNKNAWTPSKQSYDGY